MTVSDKDIATWANATFGPLKSFSRAFTRMLEEVAELGTAIARHELESTPQTLRTLRAELADVIICAARLGFATGATHDDVEVKHAINVERWWHRDGTGHGYHCKGEGCARCKEGEAAYRTKQLPGGGWEVEERAAGEEHDYRPPAIPKGYEVGARVRVRTSTLNTWNPGTIIAVRSCGELRWDVAKDNTLVSYNVKQTDIEPINVAHEERMAAMLGEPKTTDYCARCGESPDSATHVMHDSQGGHAYVDPRENRDQGRSTEAMTRDELLERFYQMERRLAELERKLAEKGKDKK